MSMKVFLLLYGRRLTSLMRRFDAPFACRK
jgi:hypothetical protein